MSDSIGRIVFPGNPWPRGHEIKDFVWSGRLVPESGIWFDFHLVSADYHAEDDPDADDEEEPDDLSDWESKSAWCNFWSCRLSSTYWAEETEGADTGVLIGTRSAPLDLRSPLRFRCDTEPHDPNDWPRPFAIYLQGHDAVGHHEFSIEPVVASDAFGIEWKARVASIYGGADEYEHELIATIPRAVFSGIWIPEGIGESEALAVASPYLAHPEGFRIEQASGGADPRLVLSVLS